jgi:hypothetical protein
VGLCFEIPGNNTTLRMGGRARLTQDPQVLAALAARGRDATLAIEVTVQYAFFHCAKAYMRSQLWQPGSWPSEADKYRVIFGPYFCASPEAGAALDGDLAVEYQQVQAAVDDSTKREPGDYWDWVRESTAR